MNAARLNAAARKLLLCELAILVLLWKAVEALARFALPVMLFSLLLFCTPAYGRRSRRW